MSIMLLSVPSTGTRYTINFLESLGLHYQQFHSEPYMYEDLQWYSGKAVIPMRDPALQWTSTYIRANLKNMEKNLEFCLACWYFLGKLESQFDVQYLRLSAKDHQLELQNVAKHCGKELLTEYNNVPVGSKKLEPTGYDEWDMYKTPEVELALKPYREKYGY